MFEQTPDQMTASVYIDGRDSRLADQYGIALRPGTTVLSFHAALELVQRFDQVLAGGGVVYAKNQKRLRSTRNQLVFAFGPDMEGALA